MSRSWSAVLIVFALICFSLPAPRPAWADGIDNDILKKVLGTGNATIKPLNDDVLRLTTNKDKLIRLDKDAASVIVNNPDHAQVMLDSPRLLIVMPRAPGATSFSVLDAGGNIILHKEIIVTNVQPQYVRIRRMCAGNSQGCEPTSYFYCPNGCYEVTAVANTGAGGNTPPPTTPPGTIPGGGPEGGNGGPGGPVQNPINSTTEPATPGGGL